MKNVLSPPISYLVNIGNKHLKIVIVSGRASISYRDENGKETRKKFNPEHVKCLGMHKVNK